MINMVGIGQFQRLDNNCRFYSKNKYVNTLYLHTFKKTTFTSSIIDVNFTQYSSIPLSQILLNYTAPAQQLFEHLCLGQGEPQVLISNSQCQKSTLQQRGHTHSRRFLVSFGSGFRIESIILTQNHTTEQNITETRNQPHCNVRHRKSMLTQRVGIKQFPR